jgi:hypothetical protein
MPAHGHWSPFTPSLMQYLEFSELPSPPAPRLARVSARIGKGCVLGSFQCGLIIPIEFLGQRFQNDDLLFQVVTGPKQCAE